MGWFFIYKFPIRLFSFSIFFVPKKVNILHKNFNNENRLEFITASTNFHFLLITCISNINIRTELKSCFDIFIWDSNQMFVLSICANWFAAFSTDNRFIEILWFSINWGKVHFHSWNILDFIDFQITVASQNSLWFRCANHTWNVRDNQKVWTLQTFWGCTSSSSFINGVYLIFECLCVIWSVWWLNN